MRKLVAAVLVVSLSFVCTTFSQRRADALRKELTAHDKAMGQLVRGRGNLLTQAKAFEQLGVSVQAALPEKLVAHAALELDSEPDPDDDALPSPGGSDGDGDGVQAVDA